MKDKIIPAIILSLVSFFIVFVLIFILLMGVDDYLINKKGASINEGLVLDKNINVTQHKDGSPSVYYYILIKDKNELVYNYRIYSAYSKDIYDNIRLNKFIKFKYVKTMILKRKFITEVL